MGAEEKKIMDSLKNAVKALPEEKREFLRGYAEGVAAMVERKETEENGRAESQDNL